MSQPLEGREIRVPVRLLALLVAAALAGCNANQRSAEATADGSGSADGKRDIWESLYLEGAKIGHSRTVIRPLQQNGRSLVRTNSFNHLKLTRFGQQIEQDLTLSTLETPDGQLVEFSTEAALGAALVKTVGRVEGGQLVIEGAPGGTARLQWSAEIRGFRGLEQSLEDHPLKPGERRKLRALAALLNQVAEIEAVAAEVEPTSLLGKTASLLRIETTSRLADGNVMQETLWTDAAGQVIKRRVAALAQESFRTTAEAAKSEEPSAGQFDLGTDTIVKLDRPLADPHRRTRIRYRVELASGEPARVFPTGPTQSIKPLGEHQAELTVTSTPMATDQQDPSHDTPGPEFTAANGILETDDTRVRAMAAEAKGTLTLPRDIALALERYVHEKVSTKDFSQTFATAAEVAESRQGDCTEHAVLLAALARVCGIPSRVAIGLVYVPRAQGFGYHMWTEVFVDGGWLPLDATLGQGSIGAAHIKLADSSLQGAGAYSAFLPVAQVVGQLKLSVLEIE